ncbi:hypothetical protein AB8880_05035 [Alphaproteobacteria bacterium LSUCC0684]
MDDDNYCNEDLASLPDKDAFLFYEECMMASPQPRSLSSGRTAPVFVVSSVPENKDWKASGIKHIEVQGWRYLIAVFLLS